VIDHHKASGVCLKAASVLSAIFAAGHTYGTLAVLHGPSHDQLRQQIVLVEGIAKTYADLFAGYGYIMTALLLMQSVILWMVAVAKDRGINVTAPVVVIALVSSGNVLFSYLYLIHIPLAFLSVITALLVASLILSRGAE
jgi:hypothetical protein